MRDEDIFIVRKELVIAVYEMISAQDQVIQRFRKAVIESEKKPATPGTGQNTATNGAGLGTGGGTDASNHRAHQSNN